MLLGIGPPSVLGPINGRLTRPGGGGGMKDGDVKFDPAGSVSGIPDNGCPPKGIGIMPLPAKYGPCGP